MKQFRRMRDTHALTLNGDDGELGTVQEFYCDDQTWAVRYVIVRTGGWLLGRDVLIPPLVIERIDDRDASMRINLKKEQIERAPLIDEARPISRQYEEAYFGYFGWAPYWQPGQTVLGSPFPYPEIPAMRVDKSLVLESPEHSHLRSSAEVTGYQVHATDGKIGRVDDLVFDDQDWIVRYVEVDTRNWLPGKIILVPTGRITRIDWPTRSVSLSLTREAIQSAPPHDPSQQITPDYEGQLSRHYRSMAV